MLRFLSVFLIAGFVVSGCATTTTELPDGTVIREREWDVSTIWEMARIVKEIRILEAELEERRYEYTAQERQQMREDIERLVRIVKGQDDE